MNPIFFPQSYESLFPFVLKAQEDTIEYCIDMAITLRQNQVHQEIMEADITNKGRRPFYFA